MSLTLPKTWSAGEVLTADDLNTQFDAIETKFAGNVSGTELVAASVPNSALTYDDYEFLVNLTVSPTTTVNPFATTGEIVAVVALPGSTTDGVGYTVLSAAHAMKDTGDAAAVTTYKVEWGAFTGAANTWAATSTIIASGGTGGNIVSGTANAYLGGTPALTTTTLPLVDANPSFLALTVVAIGANALNTLYSFLTVTLKLRRTSGLR